ncbi:hypothetical protein [Lysobacter capsici]|uniref:hypothetical protein n=1 Tax=Lysobacter capsici TaxID=435897 RepID=UPI000A5ED89A|nr:hypothetical protein [Lysobacter capsici]WND82003.1 hypothetical protein RJ610_06485 [Lysobacter capsici]WND87199.1 hypothetical protein RJ609_06490 [Lysobacter capsici]
MDTKVSHVCGSCGGPSEARIQGGTKGVYCTQCDWAVVTTYSSEIQRDRTLYEVTISGGDFRDKRQIKAISEIFGVNFLAARALLGTSSGAVLKGRAAEIFDVRHALVVAGIPHEIVPYFKY